MTFKFSPKSYKNLEGVHPKLVRVVERALQICHTDFTVTEGLRTKERQAELLKQGVTQTANSKHIKKDDGYGYAVDLYPYPINMTEVNKGNAREIVRFGLIVQACYQAAAEQGTKIRSGIDWDNDGQTLDHSFFDAPHIELIAD